MTIISFSQPLAFNPNIVGAAGRELGGVWSDRVWQFYDLIPKQS